MILEPRKINSDTVYTVSPSISHEVMGTDAIGIGKSSPEWWWLKDTGKVDKNRTKESPRTRMRISGRTNSTPGWPNLHRTGVRGGKHTYKKRNQTAGGLPRMRALVLSLSLSSLHIFWVSMPSRLKDIFSFIF